LNQDIKASRHVLTYVSLSVKPLSREKEMASKWWTIAALLPILMANAAAQEEKQEEKNELTGIIGRTFISDQGVRGTSAVDPTLRFGNGLSFELNYGRHLLGAGYAALTFEVPFVYNRDEDLGFSLNLIPETYSSFFVTPSVRANLLPGSGLSPWLSFGGGFGHFSESSNLVFGGANPGKTGTTTGVFQIGGGLDVKIWRALSLRGQVRDFNSGVPQLNVNTGKSRQHNFFVGGGVIWHF
jgi:hypothetical protein